MTSSRGQLTTDYDKPALIKKNEAELNVNRLRAANGNAEDESYNLIVNGLQHADNETDRSLLQLGQMSYQQKSLGNLSRLKSNNS